MLRYFTHIADARLAAVYASSREQCVYHIDCTDSGLFYLSDWYTAQTVATYSNGKELLNA